jgi:hypothetical protein
MHVSKICLVYAHLPTVLTLRVVGVFECGGAGVLSYSWSCALVEQVAARAISRESSYRERD